MGKNFTTAFALCLAISALPLACGDDEDDDGGGKGGKGGSSGSGTTGGRAGSATGGRAGSSTGGSTTGGRAGSGGQGGTTGGSAGSATGGMGGAEGGMGGAEGGMGGEGGMVEPPMTPCEQACAGPPGTCQATCVADWCADLNANPGATCDPLIEAAVLCFAADDAAASWTCTGGVPQYAGTDCVDEIYAAY